MKLLVGFVIASLALNVALALPAGLPKNDAEEVDVTDSKENPDFKNFQGVIDTRDVPNLQRTPSWFKFDIRSFANLMKDLRNRLCLACNQTDVIGGAGIGEADETITSIQDKGQMNYTVRNWFNNIIEINETVYDKGDGVYRVRVVSIHPLDQDMFEYDDVNYNGEPSTFTTTVDTPKVNPHSELLESDEQTDNEIRRGDGKSEQLPSLTNTPKHTQSIAHALHNTMLPTTEITTTTTTPPPPTEPSSAAINEDDVANLNGAFVTDNSLVEEAKTEQAEALKENGYGNFKAETNKSENDSDKMGNERDEDLSTSFTADNGAENEWSLVSELHDEEADEQATDDGAELAGVDGGEEDVVDEGHHLTIGNNEESEVNDNFNESSVDDVATTTPAEQELTKELNERMELIELSDRVEEDGDADSDGDADAGAAAIDGEQINEDAVAEDALDDNDNLDGDGERDTIVRGEREDIVSSDDESADDVEPVKMSDAFNSEWESLAADDLSNRNPEDLSNDIDAYEPITYDLSNDIAVNDIAAAQPDFAVDPDAEFIDIATIDGGSMKMSSHSMPMFEKLSMSQPQMK